MTQNYNDQLSFNLLGHFSQRFQEQLSSEKQLQTMKEIACFCIIIIIQQVVRIYMYNHTYKHINKRHEIKDKYKCNGFEVISRQLETQFDVQMCFFSDVTFSEFVRVQCVFTSASLPPIHVTFCFEKASESKNNVVPTSFGSLNYK